MWTRLEQAFKRNGMWLLEKLLGRRTLRPWQVNFAKIRRILVVRQHDQLGDFLLSTPVLHALRQHFPEAHITVVARSYVAPVLERNPYLDEFLVFEEAGTRWSFRKLRSFWKGLRSGYDLAVVINTVSHSFTSDLLAHFSGARYILGPEHMVFPGCRRNFFYNLIAPYWSGSRHQTERSLDIVRHLGIFTDNLAEVMVLADDEVDWARKFLAEHALDDGDLLLSCHIGAGKHGNRWPVENFARVANDINRRFHARVLVSWGPDEDDLGEQFLAAVDFEPIRAYGLSLRQLAGLISQSNVFLGNDTGILHVAAAMDVPLVAIFGPTDPRQWLPIGDRFVALRAADGSCVSVSVDEVLKKIHEMISLYTEIPKLAVDEVVTSVDSAEEEDESTEFDISEEVLEEYLDMLDKFDGERNREAQEQSHRSRED